MSRKEEIAEALLSIQAVFLRPKDPFTWASGIHSPIYCDNRLTLSFPEVRRKIEKGLAELVREHFPEASALFGTSEVPRRITADRIRLRAHSVKDSRS